MDSLSCSIVTVTIILIRLTYLLRNSLKKTIFLKLKFRKLLIYYVLIEILNFDTNRTVQLVLD